jgi:hypothetical protein
MSEPLAPTRSLGVFVNVLLEAFGRLAHDVVLARSIGPAHALGVEGQLPLVNEQVTRIVLVAITDLVAFLLKRFQTDDAASVFEVQETVHNLAVEVWAEGLVVDEDDIGAFECLADPLVR